MNKEKFQKALAYANKNPQSEFAVELKNRIKNGEFNSVLSANGVDTKAYTKPKKQGVMSRIGNALIKSEKGFGEDIAGALNPALRGQADVDKARETMRGTQDQLIQVIRDKRAKGEDPSKYVKMLQDMGNTKIATDFELNPALAKTNKQILGDAAGVAVDILGAGTLASKGAGLVTKPTTFVRGAIQGLKEGAIYGGAAGAGQGAARAAQENATGEEIAVKAVSGGAAGAVLGGAAGALLGGVAGGLNGRAARKAELQTLIDSGDLSNKKLAEFDIAPYKPPVAGDDAAAIADDPVRAALASGPEGTVPAPAPKVTSPTLQKDKTAVKAISQGFDEQDVAVIKTMTPKDKQKAIKMLDLTKKAGENRRNIERPFDVVGESVLEPAKKISETLKTKAGELDGVAKGLQNQTLDGADDVVRGIDDELTGIGAKVDADGNIQFEGSDFEGLGSNEKIIQNVYRRLRSAKDAYDFHRIKKYIDTNVNYGKSGEGLTGEAEALLKGWRRSIDGALDGQFAQYNEVNTVLSDTIKQLDELHTILGKNFNVNTPLSEIKAGQVASRILTNSPNRGEVLRILDNLQKTASKYGYKQEEDLISQIIFADMLEDMFGTQATRSLSGQVERGVTAGIEEAVGPVAQLAKGNVPGAIAEGGIKLYQKFKGINVETQMEALRALLGN